LSVSPAYYDALMGPRHSREEYETFFVVGETAQVVARDKRNGELVVIGKGQAQEIRSVTKEHFECPISGCIDRRLGTAGGPKRRDHFRHQSGGNHAGSGESWFHQQSKYILAQWAKSSALSQGLEVQVEIEDNSLSQDGQRERRPDVSIYDQSGQWRLALEVEYFNSTNEVTLAERRRDYAAGSINDIWIFGHISRHVRIPRIGSRIPDGFVEIQSVPAAIAAAGQPILVINPLERLVGTFVRTVPHGDHEWWESPQDYGLIFATLDGPGDFAEIYFDSLDECKLNSTFGILTPTIEKVLESRLEMQALAIQAKADALRKKEDALRLQEQEAIAREKKKAAAIRHQARQKEEWEESDLLRTRLLSEYQGIPEVIGLNWDTDNGVFAYHERWHALIFQEFIRNRKVGDTFEVRDIYRHLGRAGVPFPEGEAQKKRFSMAVVGYLKHLRSSGYVKFWIEGLYYIQFSITIVANTIIVPRPPIELPRVQSSVVQSPIQEIIEQPQPRRMGSSLRRRDFRVQYWHADVARALDADHNASFQKIRGNIPLSISDQEIQEMIDIYVTRYPDHVAEGED